MVDWVIAAAREARRRSASSSSPRRRARTRSTGVEVAVQEQPLGTGDAVRSARAALEGRAEDVLVLSGDTPLLTAELLRELVATHRREGAAATVLTFVPADVRAYGRIVRDGDGHVRAIVEAARRDRPRSSSSREVNSSIYVVRAEKLWPALDRLEPQNAQGELYLTDAVRFLVEDGETVAAHVAADPFEAEGVNTRVELAAAAAVLRDRINERAHARRRRRSSTRRRPGSSPTSSSSRTSTIHPFVVPPRPHAGRRAAPRSSRTRSRSTPRSGAARPSARSVTFAPGRSSRPDRRPAPSWRSRTRASGSGRRCRTSPTSATPRSARTRTSAPARSPRTSRTSPAGRRGARRSAGTSGPASTMGSSPPSRSETEHGSQPDR